MDPYWCPHRIFLSISRQKKVIANTEYIGRSQYRQRKISEYYMYRFLKTSADRTSVSCFLTLWLAGRPLHTLARIELVLKVGFPLEGDYPVLSVSTIMT
jgi:hypothetical protein